MSLIFRELEVGVICIKVQGEREELLLIESVDYMSLMDPYSCL